MFFASKIVPRRLSQAGSQDHSSSASSSYDIPITDNDKKSRRHHERSHREGSSSRSHRRERSSREHHHHHHRSRHHHRSEAGSSRSTRTDRRRTDSAGTDPEAVLKEALSVETPSYESPSRDTSTPEGRGGSSGDVSGSRGGTPRYTMTSATGRVRGTPDGSPRGFEPADRLESAEEVLQLALHGGSGGYRSQRNLSGPSKTSQLARGGRAGNAGSGGVNPFPFSRRARVPRESRIVDTIRGLSLPLSQCGELLETGDPIVCEECGSISSEDGTGSPRCGVCLTEQDEAATLPSQSLTEDERVYLIDTDYTGQYTHVTTTTAQVSEGRAITDGRVAVLCVDVAHVLCGRAGATGAVLEPAHADVHDDCYDRSQLNFGGEIVNVLTRLSELDPDLRVGLLLFSERGGLSYYDGSSLHPRMRFVCDAAVIDQLQAADMQLVPEPLHNSVSRLCSIITTPTPNAVMSAARAEGRVTPPLTRRTATQSTRKQDVAAVTLTLARKLGSVSDLSHVVSVSGACVVKSGRWTTLSDLTPEATGSQCTINSLIVSSRSTSRGSDNDDDSHSNSGSDGEGTDGEEVLLSGALSDLCALTNGEAVVVTPHDSSGGIAALSRFLTTQTTALHAQLSVKLPPWVRMHWFALSTGWSIDTSAGGPTSRINIGALSDTVDISILCGEDPIRQPGQHSPPTDDTHARSRTLSSQRACRVQLQLAYTDPASHTRLVRCRDVIVRLPRQTDNVGFAVRRVLSGSVQHGTDNGDGMVGDEPP